MPNLFTEDTYEQAIIELFENMGYDHLYAPDFDRDYTSPILDSILRDSLVRDVYKRQSRDRKGAGRRQAGL